MSQEFRLKDLDEKRNCFLECWTLSYFSFFNYCIYFNFGFCLLDWYFYIVITNSALVYAIVAGIKMYKSIIKKKKKRHD